MIAGRKPNVSALDAIHGNPGRRPRHQAIAAAPTGAMHCPSEVTDFAGAARYWKHFMRTAPAGLLRPVDAPLLARLCVALALADRAAAELQGGALVATTPNGALVQNPAIGIMNRAAEAARRFASELGLPPTGRARLNLPEAPTQPRSSGGDGDRDELDDFLDQHPDRILS